MVSPPMTGPPTPTMPSPSVAGWGLPPVSYPPGTPATMMGNPPGHGPGEAPPWQAATANNTKEIATEVFGMLKGHFEKDGGAKQQEDKGRKSWQRQGHREPSEAEKEKDSDA